MLALVAFDLTKSMGMPADIVWTADDDSLTDLQARAHLPWGQSGYTPSQCEVVEVWRIRPAPTWDQQMTRVCRLRATGWEYY